MRQWFDMNQMWVRRARDGNSTGGEENEHRRTQASDAKIGGVGKRPQGVGARAVEETSSESWSVHRRFSHRHRHRRRGPPQSSLHCPPN